MTDHPCPRLRADRGFTLPELLICIVIIGALSAAIASAFTVIVRTTPTAEARADDARSLLGLSTWLPSDVSSTPTGVIDPADPNMPLPAWNRDPAATTGCG